MQALESSLLALGPWGIAVVAAMYVFRAMTRAAQTRSATVRGLLDERTKEISDLKTERAELQKENARLEEALDDEREKRRRAEDERDRYRRELDFRQARQAEPQDSAMGRRDTWMPSDPRYGAPGGQQ